MDDSPDLTQLYFQLTQAVASWLPGDLMGLSDIGEAFAAIQAHPGFKLLPKPLVKVLKKLGGSVMDLLDEAKVPGWLGAFGAVVWPAPVPAGPTAASSVPGPSSVPEAGAPAGTYPDDYFAQVIADPGLLNQLCEEVREHLDAAQFSLVDLERDPGNAETVNRVFRSFHTLKSSAAFLGLKNIEEVAHVLEDLLVQIRDGKMAMTSDLTDVIFQGIGLLRDLAGVVETSHFDVATMVPVFRRFDIYPFIAGIKRLLAEGRQPRIGELLQRSGSLTPEAVGQILEVQKQEGGLFGEIAVSQKLVTPEVLQAAVNKQGAPHRKATYVKVLNDRLNALVDMVGELVVNQSMLRVHVTNPDTDRDAAERAVAQLESVTTGIKNLVLSMGMVSVAEIFNKLRVVIRNTASDTGKLVNAEFSGEDTELDRNIIETIYDPLVHLCRNAIDHGLESPEAREAAGKPRIGSLVIKAEHRGSGIDITIRDDGGGIDQQAVIAKALRKELLSEAQAAVLKEREVYDLLFLPGFSTREVATEISGRGVGLDVVRQNIDQIHGRVEVESTPGAGTQFTIRIPLTLAIIDGFVTLVDDTKYVFPFNLIEEILVPADAQLRPLDDGSYLVVSRDRHVPVILAGQLFGHAGYQDRVKPGLEGKLILLIGYGDRRYGVAVDGVVGKQEIVIKSLTEALAGIAMFSGGTIFGNGEIGFVVDVEEFIQAARKGEDEDSDR